MVARSRLVTLAEQLFAGRGKACNRASILRPSSTPFGALRAQWTQWAQLNHPVSGPADSARRRHRPSGSRRLRHFELDW